MNPEESLYSVALSMLPRINGSVVKKLLSRGLTPEDLFSSKTGEIEGLGWLSESKKSEALGLADNEIQFMVRHHIRPLFIDEQDYPRLLAESGNPPVVLYMLGTTELNPPKSLSIVGTRKSTPFGDGFCSKLTEDIGKTFPGTLIVSGLAYGIDAAAHNGALAANLPTVGVLGHGLDMIYPAPHRGLASTIIQRGGALLTEYPYGTRPHRNHFLDRNRIVATMSCGVVVAESPEKGGAMSTASIAFSYGRDVMAVPGRPTDPMNRGCNLLIKSNKARLIENAADVYNELGWTLPTVSGSVESPTLFPELSGNTKTVYDFLRTKSEPVSINTISYTTSLSVVILTSLLTDMEFDGLVRRCPGNRYEVIG